MRSPALDGCWILTNDLLAGVSPTNWDATGRTSSTNENMTCLKGDRETTRANSGSFSEAKAPVILNRHRAVVCSY